MDRSELERCIAAQQLPDGSFPAAARTGSDLQPIRARTFVTSLALESFADSEPLEPARRSAERFLLGQRSKTWSWNYDLRNDPLSGRFPEDVDDTVCALAALQRSRPGLLSAEVTAALVTMLTCQETAPGGPYRTWIVPPEADQAWLDVDFIVNSNIAYCLGLHGVSLPNLEAMADSAILGGDLLSPYYPSAPLATYLVSRWYRGKHLNKLRALITGLAADTPLRAALKLLSSMHAGVPYPRLTGLYEYLHALSLSDLGPEPLYRDSRRDGADIQPGCLALTAAYVWRALGTYERSPADSPRFAPPPSAKRLVKRRLQAIVEAHSQPLRGMLENRIKWTLHLDDSVPIASLPHLVERAFGSPAKASPAAVDLGTAISLGWIAYTVYDGLLDSGVGSELVPAANCAAREMVAILCRYLPEQSGFWQVCQGVLRRQEAAQLWELQHCRVLGMEIRPSDVPDFGDYRMFAERAGGHALGAIGIAYLRQCDPASIRSLQEAIDHITIARQLNDDAHDWQADLRLGQINSVSALLLGEYFTGGARAFIAADTDALAELSSQFWLHAIDLVAERVDAHLERAKSAIRSLDLPQPEFLTSLLEPPERSMRQALAGRREAAQFLTAYRTTSR